MDLNLTIQASSPILLLIQKIDNQLPKTRYVVYCEIPTQLQCFQPLDNLTHMTLTRKIVKFKILDLQSTDSLPAYQIGQVKALDQERIQIYSKLKSGSISMTGKILNQSDNSGVVFALSIEDISGFSSLTNFRKKYKTLENVTRKQEFELDYRLKVVDEISNSVFYFSMEESDTSKYFFSNRKLRIFLQEIFHIEDWQTVQPIHEEQLNLSNLQGCATAVLSIMNKLKLTLNIQLIKNSNFTQSQIASLRILQITPQVQSVIVGTDKVNEMVAIKRLQSTYFDYEYAYLNKNLKQLQGTSVYEHIDKLTHSFPKYPHFINSKIIHVAACRCLMFKIGESSLKLPFVYILQGFNILQTEDISIKFYIEFKDAAQKIEGDKLADCRKFEQLSIKDIWNLGSVAKKYQQFQLKIMSQNIIYSIPFKRSEIDKSSFRKQANELEMKEQYAQFNENKYYLLTKSIKKDKIFITKTENINQFYLLDLGTSTSVFFQIVAHKQVTHQGLIRRGALLSSNGIVQVILSSPDSTEKIILIASISEIKQKNQSLRIYYKVMQRLQFTDDTPCDNIRYSLEIKRLSDNKKIKAQISPQMQSDGISSLNAMQDGFYHPASPELQMMVTVRKMFFDEETQVFDNDEILSKKIIVNSSAGKLLQKNCSFLRIDEEGFTAIDYEFYDANIKKRLKLYLEFVVRKNQFFDATSGSYRIKIPAYLWKNNACLGNSPEIIMRSHLSHKKKKGGSVNVFPDSPQQYTLPFFNCKDGISIHVNGEVGYQKIMDAIKLRCDIVKNNLGWLDESEWYLGIVNVGKNAFQFMIKYSFEGIGDQSDKQSVNSRKTEGKNKSERSYGEKIDPLAKTVRNMDLFNLKKMKNDVVAEGRKLTTKYVKCQETITALSKKLIEIDDLSAKRIQQQREAMNMSNSSKMRKPGKNKQTNKLSQFYRSICQCGAKNPKFNGYCQACLKQMKKRYETYLKQYKERSYIYEKICFDKFNNKEKLIRIKNKIKSYKEKIKSGQNFEDNDVDEVVKNLEEQQLKRMIESSKIAIFRMKEQQENIENAGKRRQQAIEEQIKKEDDEILASMQEIDMLNNQIQDLREKLKQIQ